jgi:hypothetical protein
MFPSIITEKTRNDPIYARIMENRYGRIKTKVAPITIKEKTKLFYKRSPILSPLKKTAVLQSSNV